MALDRPDLSFASKVLARGMANPTEADVIRLKRILRYLKGTPNMYICYPWQDPPKVVTGYGDSDWAGCRVSRKSTSGGAMFFGKHLIHHFSNTQTNVALSSAEAELNASVKVFCECICIKNMCEDVGIVCSIVVKTDSSAAKGIMTRRGCGKIKHIAAKQLWIQEYVINGDVVVHKVPRNDNPSDAFTHNWSGVDSKSHFVNLGLYSSCC